MPSTTMKFYTELSLMTFDQDQTENPFAAPRSTMTLARKVDSVNEAMEEAARMLLRAPAADPLCVSLMLDIVPSEEPRDLKDLLGGVNTASSSESPPTFVDMSAAAREVANGAGDFDIPNLDEEVARHSKALRHWLADLSPPVQAMLLTQLTLEALEAGRAYDTYE